MQVYEFAPNLSILYDQPSDTHGKLESSRPRAAGIEVEDSVLRLLLRHMTVAADHDRESSSLWFEVQLRKIMHNIDGYAANFENFRVMKLERLGVLVDIAAHSSQRCDSRKFSENLRCAHIPGVNDVLGSAQRPQRFGPQQTVGVRDDANQNGVRAFPLFTQFSPA